MIIDFKNMLITLAAERVLWPRLPPSHHERVECWLPLLVR